MTILIGLLPAVWVVLAFACVIGWLISEVNRGRRTRITLGLLSLFFWASLTGSVASAYKGISTTFTLNALFGSTSKRLVDHTIAHLDAGHTESVLQGFKRLQDDFPPFLEEFETAENYKNLVQEVVHGLGPLPEKNTTE